MKCPTCSYEMQEAGCCIHTGQPVRWCAACGTIRTCDGFEAAPADALAKYRRVETLPPPGGGNPATEGPPC